MTDLVIRCALCGEPVDPLSQWTWQRVTGWQRMAGVRASGKYGGSDIRLREPLQEWAHPHCVARAKSGVSPQQEALV